MSKHSKTPWTFEENDDFQLMVYDDDGNPVAQIVSEECEADAKFIIKSVNENEPEGHTRPPLGLVPRCIRDMERVTEILEAIGRYNEAGQPVPKEWLEELAYMLPRSKQPTKVDILRGALVRIVDLLKRESPLNEDGVDPVEILTIARESVAQADATQA